MDIYIGSYVSEKNCESPLVFKQALYKCQRLVHCVCGNSRTKAPEASFHRLPYTYVNQLNVCKLTAKRKYTICLATSQLLSWIKSIDHSTTQEPCTSYFNTGTVYSLEEHVKLLQVHRPQFAQLRLLHCCSYGIFFVNKCAIYATTVLPRNVVDFHDFFSINVYANVYRFSLRSFSVL